MFAATTVATGVCIDRLVAAGHERIEVYTGVFLVGFVGRMLGVPVVMAMNEPGALRLRDLPAQLARRSTPT